MPLVLLLAAMASFQAGASLAKGLFPLIGPSGVVALRVVLGAVRSAAREAQIPACALTVPPTRKGCNAFSTSAGVGPMNAYSVP